MIDHNLKPLSICIVIIFLIWSINFESVYWYLWASFGDLLIICACIKFKSSASFTVSILSFIAICMHLYGFYGYMNEDDFSYDLYPMISVSIQALQLFAVVAYTHTIKTKVATCLRKTGLLYSF